MIKSTVAITPDQLKNAADVLSRGKNGDTILARISPEEAAILKQRGGAGQKDQYGITQFFPEDGEDQTQSSSSPGTDSGTDSGTPVGTGTDTPSKITDGITGSDVIKSITNFAKNPTAGILDALGVNDILGVKSIADIMGEKGTALDKQIQKQNAALQKQSDAATTDGSSDSSTKSKTGMGKVGELIDSITSLQDNAQKLMGQIGKSNDFASLVAAFSPRVAQAQLTQSVQKAMAFQGRGDA